MKRFAAGLSLLASLGGGSLAAQPAVDLAVSAPCSIDVYSLDEDEKGLNVRAGPSASTPIVATLQNQRAQGGEDYAVEMHVIGSKNGWLLIDRAWFRDYGESNQAGTVFSAKGWVSGSLAGSDVGDPTLRAAPSPTAKVAATLYSPNSSGPSGHIDRFEVSRIFACSGAWADVEGEFRGQTKRGWATRLCSNQTSVCR